MTQQIFLGSRCVSSNDLCYIIAEIAVNHNGSVSVAHEMLEVAKAACADAVKFPTFRIDALVVAIAAKAEYQVTPTGEGNRTDMMRALDLQHEDGQASRQHCAMVRVDFLSTAFDAQSLVDIIALNPTCLKWPSGELNNITFLRQAAATGLPLLLSAGIGSIAEIATAIDVLATGGLEDVCILQYVSNNPARIEDQKLRVIPAIAQVFVKVIGFSGHTDGPYATIPARRLRMAVLEKHFTLNRKMSGPDHAASVEKADFGQRVDCIRQIETVLGGGVKRMMWKEKNTLSAARKSLMLASNFPSDHVLQAKYMAVKRLSTKLVSSQVDFFIGRALRCAAKTDTMVQLDYAA